jgi:hypothetical protein
MVDILLLQTVSIAIASAGVFLAAMYYIFQIRHQTKQRQTDMVLRLYSTFGSAEFQKGYQLVMHLVFKNPEDYRDRYGTDTETISALYSVTVFFEGIGLLVKRKLVSMDLVDDLFSGPVQSTWEKIGVLIEALRARSRRTSVGEWFEYLYNEMKKREQKLQLSKLNNSPKISGSP